MYRDYYPSLMVIPKWHHSKRNIAVGDVVIIQDSNTIRGEWKTGEVSRVYLGGNGIVRRCDKRKTQEFVRQYTTRKRAVQKLVVIIPVGDKY